MAEKICFVACPIGSDSSPERSRSNSVLNHIIKPVCEELGFKVIRVDELALADKIDQTIMQYLDTADLVIADMTDHNANVFYEFGYRHAKNLPLIPIIEDGSAIPFDVSTHRTIKYAVDNLDKAADAKRRLSETISSFASYVSDSDTNNSDISALFSVNEGPSLLSIHDKLDEIIELLNRKNDDVIEMVTSQVAKYAQPQQSPEIALMTTLIPSLLENPTALNNFMKLAEFGNKRK